MYSMPGSSSLTVAAVLSPDTANSWRRPPGLVGTYVTRYSVTSISFFQDKSTVSLVTSPTVRSFGGDTGKSKKNFTEGVFLDRFSCPQSHSIHPTELMQTPEPHLAVVWTTARRVRTKCTEWQYTNQKLLYSRKYFFSRWVGSEIGE